MPYAGMLIAEAASSTSYEAARLHQMDQWWQWLIVLAVCLAVLVWSAVAYYYDSVEISRGLAVLLFALRLTAFVGILVFFLDIEKRTDRQLIKNSRAVVLVDTSLSMKLPAAESGQTRIDRVLEEFTKGDLLPQLQKSHDVIVYRFDEDSQPTEVASFTQLIDPQEEQLDSSSAAGRTKALTGFRWFLVVAGIALLASVVSLGVHWIAGRSARSKRRQAGESQSWSLLLSGVLLIASLVIVAVGSLRHMEVPFSAAIGLTDWQPAGAEQPAEQAPPKQPLPAEIAWEEKFALMGKESRLGDALQYIIAKERGGTLAGVIVLTDGGQNAGGEPALALKLASDEELSIFPIGLGSEKRVTGVRVVDVEAPTRVYPGDRFTITAYIQGRGLDSRMIDVALLTRPDNAAQWSATGDQESLRLGSDGEVQPVKFEVEPPGDGTHMYMVRVPDLGDQPLPAAGENDEDTQPTVSVEVVDRQNRVMLIAGGPTREFRFLRNQLFRDPETEVHVLLQTALPGISQEANEVLSEFPASEDELFEYDCIVAFDPDWLELDELQFDMLERWVSEKAGGLIVIAGPVYTPRWSMERRGDPRIDRIKALYPVSFYYRGSAMLSMGRFGGDAAWPLQFTRDGLDAEFLWLEDDAVGSEATWSEFEGVYGYYAAKDAKAGAKVYARFSDPDTEIDDTLPVYLAGHFYGAGRVFYQASGEMWRIRALDDSYFETYYTKLIRHVSQGRLVRDSARGVLLVEQDRCFIGDHIAVRARLTDAQHRPLGQEQVAARLIAPDGKSESLPMTRVRDGSTEGMYAAQFTPQSKGTYRIELEIPQSDDIALLKREVRVRVPEREIEQPQRNDALLTEIADKTGGLYYIGIDAALNRQATGVEPVTSRLTPKYQKPWLTGAPDKEFELLLMTWLLVVICGALCFEWLLRRLSKLA